LTRYNTRALVESALLAVIGMVLVLLGQYVPFLGIAALFLWPLPSALVVLRHGMRWGVMASIITALCLSLFMNWITALSLWVLFGLTGLTFGYAVLKQFSPAKIIVVTSAAFLMGILSEFLLAYLLTGSPMRYLDEMLRAMQASAGLTEKALGPSPFTDMFKDFDLLKDQILKVLPFTLVFSAMLQSYINFEVLRRVLDRFGHHLDPLPPFSRRIFPEYIAHGAIISYTAAVLGIRYKLPVVEQVGQNIFAGVSFLLLIETASVVSYYISRQGLPKVFSVLTVFYIVANPVLNVLAVFFGMIDILFDFRRLRYGYLNDM
jgi:uncharacterized protein YybS (DUF2232 family)